MVVFSKAAYMASHGDITPVRNMFQSWVFGIMLPVSAVAWTVSGGSIVVSVTAAMTIPMVAIAQGSLGILRYRLHFGNAPLPLSPSHGVVVVDALTKAKSVIHPTASNHEHIRKAISPNLEQPIQLQKTKSFPISLGCQCGLNHSQAVYCEKSATTLHGRASLDDNSIRGGSNISPSSIDTSLGTFDHESKRPIRLLLIGDSLAIGVGQARQCTPVMPEVLAKTLSHRLGGRIVYWTCHGAPGASTGWIVRELERGVTYLNKESINETTLQNDDDDDDPSMSQHQSSLLADRTSLEKGITLQNCSDTDESSSDESTSDSKPPCTSLLHANVWLNIANVSIPKHWVRTTLLLL
jgi:hypothetical protein